MFRKRKRLHLTPFFRVKNLLLARSEMVLNSQPMVLRPDYRTVLRFAFLIVGWADVAFSARFVFDSTTRTMNFLFSSFPTTFFLGVIEGCLAIVVILATFPGVWFLCLATAWGLKRNRSWARRTGIAASLCLLPTFPWLTALGVVGLIAILSLERPISAPQPVQNASGALRDDYCSRESRSRRSLRHFS
jgi:hypothetical protein